MFYFLGTPKQQINGTTKTRNRFGVADPENRQSKRGHDFEIVTPQLVGGLEHVYLSIYWE